MEWKRIFNKRAVSIFILFFMASSLLIFDESEWTLTCLLYTSDAADERSSVDLGGRRIIKKKKNVDITVSRTYNNKQHKHKTRE